MFDQMILRAPPHRPPTSLQVRRRRLGRWVEWRRAHGYEGVDVTNDDSAILVGWRAKPPERRQLPVAEDELIPGAGQAVGVGELCARRAFGVVDGAFMKRHVFVGLQVPGLGVIGPFGIDPSSTVDRSGLAPAGSEIELVA